MTRPPSYDQIAPLAFGGVPGPGFEQAQVVILPIPLERTTSYGAGTRHGPREILQASAYLELWDEELQAGVEQLGICTLPEMELPFGEMAAVIGEIRRVAHAIAGTGKFLVALGGEHSITPPIVAALAAIHRGLTVLQIDAHADLRDAFMGSPYSHACAMRRVLEHAAATQVAIRSLSPEEAAAVPRLGTRLFYDCTLREDPHWVDRVVDSLGDPVYITIDCDGLDPAIMPAVGTPEPGGLSWYELLRLLRATFAQRRVVGCDLVELAPIPGVTAPNFLCAKLVLKLITYRFSAASATQRPRSSPA